MIKPWNICFVLALLLASAVAVISADAPPSAPAPAARRQVVVVVMDGLRRDAVTAEQMPILNDLARRGVRFTQHHSAFVTSTEVNGAVLATGYLPARTGVLTNNEYIPAIDKLGPVDRKDAEVIRKGDAATHGKYMPVDTVPEILHRLKIPTAVAGTKAVAIHFDRVERDDAAGVSPTLFDGRTYPASLMRTLEATIGAYPAKADAKSSANLSQDEWTTRALTERFWSGGLPAYSVLWLSEPDFAQHGSSVGSPVATAALKSSDDNLARVLKAIKDRGGENTTDVIVVSDHGFSTISKAFDMTATLDQAGFNAVNRFSDPAKPDEILVVPNGGEASLHLAKTDEALLNKLIAYLQAQSFTGVILTKERREGTFAFADAGIDSPGAPDVVVSMRWTHDKNEHGKAGMVVSVDRKYKQSQGIHSSLGPYDLHNTLIACGPSFKKGFASETASGNVDVAPTALWILGRRDESARLDGRVLAEALTDSADTKALEVKVDTLVAKAPTQNQPWSQYLRVIRVGKSFYLDEGNAGEPPK